ncbi:unnamed protein product [Candidula unifasciata]|uniref:Uncharacterized protein n=1 Tax=Candidula unifasciata TaxID=100452 RepID=A0A8S3YJF5_9EUPU|nr:unnamed protein product [Candidula unifasciata]
MLTYRKKRKKRIKECKLSGPLLSFLWMCLWPVLVSVGAALLPRAAGEDVPGVVSTSSYPSGEVCGSMSQRNCLSKSCCTQFRVCQCPPGMSGDGGFHCYPTNTIQAQIQGDSQLLRTFHNTSVVMGWPCRFRLTEFSTMRNVLKQTCLFQVFGVNQIVGGRIATTGVEVHLQLTQGSKILGGIGIRNDGKAANGVFTYTERGRNQFINELPVTGIDEQSDDSMADGSGSGDGSLIDDDEDNDKYDWGPPEELDVDGERVVSQIDEDNFATVDVPSCGTTVRFRAPDLEAVDDSQTPGPLCEH